MLASLIATAFLGGEQTAELATARAQLALGHRWPSLASLAERYLHRFRHAPRPRHQDVREFIRHDRGFRVAQRSYLKRPTVRRWIADSPLMQPFAAAAGWHLPAITTTGELAGWLGLDPADLAWFADLRSLERKSGPLVRHYEYQIHRKPDGRLRLIESPKTRMKQIQRQILREILDRVPAHAAAHGFVKGRSIRSFAAPHTGQRLVVRFDLENFFPSLRRARPQAMFRTLGYPESVADSLGGLCTNWTPRDVFAGLPVTPETIAARFVYGRPHLPQGAPTSPALANLCAYHLDCRLAALAQSAGAVYTRYADDLAFSGDDDFRRGIHTFLAHVANIIQDEGFAVNTKKTRLMPASTRQHLAGLVTNVKPNLQRADFDQLKATLTNCLRSGPGSQNRDGHPDFRAHLAGRIAFCAMVNPEKARRLQAIFAKIYS